MASILDGVPVVENEVFKGQTKEGDFPKKAPPAFREGDQVRLKSGGPTLTVLSCRGPSVEVAWHPADGAMHKVTVPVASVVPA